MVVKCSITPVASDALRRIASNSRKVSSPLAATELGGGNYVWSAAGCTSGVVIWRVRIVTIRRNDVGGRPIEVGGADGDTGRRYRRPPFVAPFTIASLAAGLLVAVFAARVG